MNGGEQSAYGVWILVILNSLIIIIFAFSFTQPKSKIDWRSFGAFSAFIIALFTEMYGFPLTIYLLSGWLGEMFPGINLFAHDSGHLWVNFFDSKINPHFHPIHLIANVLIISGFILLSVSWKVLHKVQKNHQLATTGVYKIIRHPQYIGFIAIMLGYLVLWPTLLTLIMFPILVYMYCSLALKEEKILISEFGEEHLIYRNKTPAFVPNFSNLIKGRN